MKYSECKIGTVVTTQITQFKGQPAHIIGFIPKFDEEGNCLPPLIEISFGPNRSYCTKPKNLVPYEE